MNLDHNIPCYKCIIWGSDFRLNYVIYSAVLRVSLIARSVKLFSYLTEKLLWVHQLNLNFITSTLSVPPKVSQLYQILDVSIY
jgi:hypothetical protein